ncbi:MAG: heavy metal translocating P-type ATPase [Pseudomonadota bacterium]
MTHSLTFRVQGLSCASCLRRAETAASGPAGIAHAAINLAGGTLTLEAADADAVRAATQATGAAGYQAETRSTRLVLGGLHCASCVGKVERALEGVPGVLSAEVNLATSEARLTHISDPAVVSAAIKAVEKTGFEAARPTDIGPEHKKAEHTPPVLWAALLALPVVALDMGAHLVPALHHAIGATIGHGTAGVLQFVLVTVLLAWPGRAFFTRGVGALARGAPDMNTLVALGTGAAWAYSTAALFLPGLFPAGQAVLYFESAAVIATFILLGRRIEARAKGQAGRAIEALVGLQPRTAQREAHGTIEEVAIDQIAPGDVVQVKPGERLSVDGTVLTGASSIDAAMLTGEPLPVDVAPGSDVVGGTLNTTGLLRIQATATGADTVLAEIAAMVRRAQSSKLPIQSLIDRVTSLFVPIVMRLGLATLLGWLLVTGDLARAMTAAVSVLIIACPCAMGLATPMSIVTGAGRAARLGVLFRNGAALQRLAGVKVAAFDKTGTLTMGRPEVTLVDRPGHAAPADLAPLGALAATSTHPLAEAIAAYLDAKAAVTDVKNTPGLGVAGSLAGQRLRLGSAAFMDAAGLAVPDTAQDEASLVYGAVDDAVVAVFHLTDPAKPEAARAIAALKGDGVRTVLISGDREGPAQAIGKSLGLDEVIAGVLPGEKADHVRRIAGHGPVAFTGDGINDAPALAAADVGLAIGTGTDVAIEAADVVLMSGNLDSVARARAISRATMANIRQNLFWAFAYNVTLIPVAALGLLSPVAASAAMALSSLFVVFNSQRLRWAGQGRQP